MSHFLMGVVVPRDEVKDYDFESYINGMMEKYSENLEVEGYIDVTKEEVLKKYEEHCQDKSESVANFWEDWSGGKLDEEGNGLSTYNPDSKWDWYVIGGRWDGAIKGDRIESTDGGFNFGDEHHEVTNNLTTVKDLLELIKSGVQPSPFGIVSSGGEWYEKGEMGWFGCVKDEKEQDDHNKELIAVLEVENPDDWVVGLDCHI